SPSLVASLRKQHADRSEPWTIEELADFEPTKIAYASNWKLTASHNEKELKLAFDGNDKTRYTTGKSMAPGMWIQIEFPEVRMLSGINLDTSRSKGDFPRGYQVQVSDDGKNWSAPVAEGAGNEKFQILFPKTSARFLRITQTGKDKLFWSIHEMNLLGKE
ncbi:MAG: discoidin domain-containing protein, partial [Akkermansiaceae bacterium]|nr:discoidin domain-containing protein [Akkermansiaceae bacterium]